MGNNVGYRRKAKFAPGAVLEAVKVTAIKGKPVRELLEYVVLDICKPPTTYKNLFQYFYKVYSKNNKTIQYIQPQVVEKMKQVDLANIANLRILLDDAVNGFDATPPASLPNHNFIIFSDGLTVDLTKPKNTTKSN